MTVNIIPVILPASTGPFNFLGESVNLLCFIRTPIKIHNIIKGNVNVTNTANINMKYLIIDVVKRIRLYKVFLPKTHTKYLPNGSKAVVKIRRDKKDFNGTIPTYIK